jgi:hypothetical protein
MSSDMVLEVADRPVCDDDADTAQIVAELVERRSIVRHWLRWWRPSKRREAIEMVEAQDGILFEGLGLDRPSWRLKDEEFAELVARFRRSRGGKVEGRAATDPVRASVPAARAVRELVDPVRRPMGPDERRV